MCVYIFYFVWARVRVCVCVGARVRMWNVFELYAGAGKNFEHIETILRNKYLSHSEVLYHNELNTYVYLYLQSLQRTFLQKAEILSK